MAADDLHTVLVPESSSTPGAALLVVEGPSASRASTIYSPRGDLTISSDNLYLPMPRARAIKVTEAVLRLAQQG